MDIPVTIGASVGQMIFLMPPPVPPYQPLSSSTKSNFCPHGLLYMVISPEPVVSDASLVSRGPYAVTQRGRIASTSSPVRSSKPVKSWPREQRATNWPPPGPPSGGSIASVCACAERTKNNIATDAKIKRPCHFNCHRVYFLICCFINFILNFSAR